jgi:hypothetical protein
MANGPYIIVGTDGMYGSTPNVPPTKPAALILQSGAGAPSANVNITLSALNMPSNPSGVYLFCRQWPNGWPNGQGGTYLFQQWTGDQILVPTWSVQSGRVGTPISWSFAVSPTQAWSIIAQTPNGVISPYTVSVTPATGQVLNSNFNATFTNVDGQNNIGVVIQVSSSTGR